MTVDKGAFVISLDFELLWGVRDRRTVAQYGAHILGVRQVVPRLLDLFEAHAVRCTWATVGFLFFEDRDELLAHLPDLRPNYRDPRLSPYPDIEKIGPNERKDPYHFGLSMLRQVMAAPGQEVATHTFSHYYCLESGQTIEAFRADLEAARRAAARLGVTLKSLVFPRNQFNDAYLDVCREAGLTCFRGNPDSWLYRAATTGESPLKRASRLADSYVSLSGDNAATPTIERAGLINIPASFFLRPFSSSLRRLEGLRIRRITQAMEAAARDRAVFHLWWHPHNFGADQNENFLVLGRILATFARLRDRFGWRSATMRDVAAGLTADSF
jgi:peptidoglycan/xylan/chitin deacetylase (PgdA/CDA1 family)